MDWLLISSAVCLAFVGASLFSHEKLRREADHKMHQRAEEAARLAAEAAQKPRQHVAKH